MGGVGWWDGRNQVRGCAWVGMGGGGTGVTRCVGAHVWAWVVWGGGTGVTRCVGAHVWVCVVRGDRRNQACYRRSSTSACACACAWLRSWDPPAGYEEGGAGGGGGAGAKPAATAAATRSASVSAGASEEGAGTVSTPRQPSLPRDPITHHPPSRAAQVGGRAQVHDQPAQRHRKEINRKAADGATRPWWWWCWWRVH
jgi:hypothetical protein